MYVCVCVCVCVCECIFVIHYNYVCLSIPLVNDWTMYPFLTKNSTDYENLSSVYMYMDCVFFLKLRELNSNRRDGDSKTRILMIGTHP